MKIVGETIIFYFNTILPMVIFFYSILCSMLRGEIKLLHFSHTDMMDVFTHLFILFELLKDEARIPLLTISRKQQVGKLILNGLT